MTTELTMLALTTALLFILIVIQASAGVAALGYAPLAGARDDLPPPTGFRARTKRVVDNHREGLTLFAPVVLIAAAAHISNHFTVLGTEIYFVSRLLHAAVYLAGLPHIRPFIYGAGVVGLLLVLGALFGLP